MKVILCCEDSLEGIFEGIYEGWAGKYGHENVELQLGGEEESLELFARYVEVPADPERAGKVERTIRSRMGWEVYTEIGKAALSAAPDRGTAVYRLVVRALSMECPGRVLEVLTDAGVRRVLELSRNVWNEAHHLQGFVRFEELAGGVLLSVIGPKNRVLPVLAPHFSDRLPQENWAIYDRTHQEFALHRKGRPWVRVLGESLGEGRSRQLSAKEREVQRLWKGFCQSIMIRDRENASLQNELLPKRFQKYMTEFE